MMIRFERSFVLLDEEAYVEEVLDRIDKAFGIHCELEETDAIWTLLFEELGYFEDLTRAFATCTVLKVLLLKCSRRCAFCGGFFSGSLGVGFAIFGFDL